MTTESDQLPEPDHLLSEADPEHRWAEAFARSADLVAELADEALAQVRAGQTEPLDPDRL